MEGDLGDKEPADGFDISIHALRVEGDQYVRYPISYNRISIHALRVEGDREIPDVQSAFHVIFLSTPSGWRAT